MPSSYPAVTLMGRMAFFNYRRLRRIVPVDRSLNNIAGLVDLQICPPNLADHFQRRRTETITRRRFTNYLAGLKTTISTDSARHDNDSANL